MPNLTDEQWERIGQAVDQLDALTTGLTVMTTVPDRIHVEALRKSLPEVLGALRAVASEVDPEGL